MAVCRTCNTLAEHGVRPNGRKMSQCRECVRAYSRDYYEQNRPQYAANRRRNERLHRERLRSIVHEAKGKPCTDCGNLWPYYVMQFDHRDPSSKSFTIGDLYRTHARRVTVDRLLAEIAKCDPVCGNCHAIREHNRREGRHYLDDGRDGET